MYTDKMETIKTSVWKQKVKFEHFSFMDLGDENWPGADAWLKSRQAASQVTTFGLLLNASELLLMQWINQ